YYDRYCAALFPVPEPADYRKHNRRRMGRPDYHRYHAGIYGTFPVGAGSAPPAEGGAGTHLGQQKLPQPYYFYGVCSGSYRYLFYRVPAPAVLHHSGSAGGGALYSSDAGYFFSTHPEILHPDRKPVHEQPKRPRNKRRQQNAPHPHPLGCAPH